MVLLGSSFCFGLANPMLNLDLPFSFICIVFPQHDHMFTGLLSWEVDACAYDRYQATLTPPLQPGYKVNDYLE